MKKEQSFFAILFLCSYSVQAQTRYMGMGLIIKEDINRSLNVSRSEGGVVNQSQPGNGIGLSCIYRQNSVGFSLQSVFTGAKYDVSFNQSPNVFQKADIKFLQINGAFEFFPANKYIYLFAGPQLLIRRFGTEYYTNGVVANSVWPRNRIMFNYGAGADLPIRDHFQARIFAGLRYNTNPNQVLYDYKSNQIFFGLSLHYVIRNTAKKSKKLGCFKF